MSWLKGLGVPFFLRFGPDACPSHWLTALLLPLFPAARFICGRHWSALNQQQPSLYRQVVQCQEALTQIISAPQRGQELSDMVLAAVRRPVLQPDAGWTDAIGRR